MAEDNLLPKMTVEEDGVLSASFEETNNLRARLGMKPLRTAEEEKEKLIDASKIVKEPTAAEIRESADAVRRAKVRSKLTSVQPLGDMLAEDDDLDPFAWVSKHRKSAAERTALLHESPSEKPRTASAARKRKRDEGGGSLRVTHDLSQFEKMEEGGILTLKDVRLIGKDGELAEGGDELEERALREREDHDEYLRKKKLAYKGEREAHADPDQSHYSTGAAEDESCRILPKYNEWLGKGKKQQGFSLHVARVDEDEEDLLIEPDQDVSETSSKVPTGKPVDLHTKIAFQSDYHSHDAMQAMLGRPRLRRKPKVRRPPLEVPSSVANGTGEEQSLKSDDCVEGNNIDQDSMMSGGAQGEAVFEDESETEDSSDKILYAHLSKQLKEVTQRRAVAGGDERKLLQQIKRETKVSPLGIGTGITNVKMEEVKKEEEDESDGIQMTSTTEFCRFIRTPTEKLEGVKHESYAGGELYRRQLNKKAEALGGQSGSDFANRAPGTGSASDGPKSSNDGKDETTHDDASDDELTAEEMLALAEELGHERPLGASISDALERLKERGDLDGDVFRVGRKNKDCRPMHIGSDPNEVKLEHKDRFGRMMTQKEAFRHISWIFHGKGPGKKKREAMLKRMELEKRLRKLDPVSESKTMRALRKNQQVHEQAHLTLSHVGGQQ